MDLSIVIVSWNTQEFLRRCLLSLQEDAANSADYEIETIVVDNASADGSVEMMRADFPWVKLAANEDNLGFARANNQGILHSTGRFVLLLNSDTEVHAGAVAALVSFMGNNPQAGAAGARLLNTDGSLQAGCHRMLKPGREFWQLIFLENLWPRSTYPLDKWDDQTPRQVEVIKGACLMLRREALVQVGLLDERYHMYTEEVDLCYRFSRYGWQLWYIPTAVVTHFGGASSRQVAAKMYLQLYQSKIQFYRKFGGRGLARQFKILLAIATVPRAILRPNNSNYRRLLATLREM